MAKNTVYTADDINAMIQSGEIYRMSASQLAELKAEIDSTLWALIETELDAFKVEHNLVEDDAGVYAQNAKTLAELSEKQTLDDVLSDTKVKDIVDRIEITETVETNGKEEQAALSAEEKNKILALVLKAAQESTAASLYGSKKFSRQSKKQQKKTFLGATRKNLIQNLAKMTAASAIEKPTAEEMELGSAANLAYSQRQEQLGAKAIENLDKGSEKISIKADQVWMSLVETSKNIDSYVGVLRQKAAKMTGDAHMALKNVEVQVKSRWQKFEEKADTVSNGKYKKFKSIVRGVSDNKFQIATNMLATFALSASGYGAAALLGYGAWMVASAYISPISAKMSQIKHEAKEKGEKMSFAQRWSAVRAEVKKDKKHKTKIIATTAVSAAVFGTLAAATGGILPAGVENLAAPILARSAKRVVSVGRTLVATTAQLTQTVMSGLNCLKNKEDEKAKKEFKQARRSFYAAVLVAGVGQYIGAKFFDAHAENLSDSLQSVNATDNVQESLGSSSTVNSNWPDMGRPDLPQQDITPIMQDGADAPVQTTDGTNVSGLQDGPGVDEPVVDEPVFDRNYMAPERWSEDMGISREAFLKQKFEELNITSKDDKAWYIKLHYGDESTGYKPMLSEDVYQHAYMKLSQDGVMANYGDMDKDLVIVKYMEMFAMYRRTGYDLVAGSAGISTDAFWAKSPNDPFPQQMADMYNFLFCDQRAAGMEDGTHDLIAGAAKFIKENRQVETNNVMTQFERDCANIGKGSLWKGQRVVEAPDVPEEVVETPPTREEVEKLMRMSTPVEDKPEVVAENIPDRPKVDNRVEEKPQIRARHFISNKGSDAIKGTAVVQEDITNTARGQRFIRQKGYGD